MAFSFLMTSKNSNFKYFMAIICLIGDLKAMEMLSDHDFSQLAMHSHTWTLEWMKVWI